MKNKKLKFVMAQINPTVGDLDSNFIKIKHIILDHQNSDIIIFPEMALTGYPLMDHIHDPLIQKKNQKYIEKLKDLDSKPVIIVGSFTNVYDVNEKLHPFYNSAILIQGREIKAIVNKRILPNYDVFDERRYFTFEKNFDPIKIHNYKVGVLICEDVWDEDYELKVAEKLVQNGAEILVVINASPYHINKFNLRKDLICKKSHKYSTPIIYVNMVGGLDEIVYDGRSFITNKFGQIQYIAKEFEEDISEIEINPLLEDNNTYKWSQPDWRESVLRALELNLYDYFHKSNNFKGVVLGLSGGIDSAFTAYVCANAIGSEHVTAIMMPTRFTSQESMDLANKLCKNLKINYLIHSIDSLFTSYQNDIKKNLGDIAFDVADENLQARIRATILMYYSNKYDWLLVSTGNKSEIGVGYCTLYGDTNGGKNVPGDLYKGQIYDICNLINRISEIIPRGIIDRPPTAELRENQKDSDSLPNYEVLDLILEEIVRYGIGSEYENLKKRGVSKETIIKVRNLYLNSEYKRRQLVQTIKVSESAFGIGRRYPVLKRIRFKDL